MTKSALVLAGVVFAPSTAFAQDVRPPPPMDPNAQGSPAPQPPTPTTARLTAAEREDNGRDLEYFYMTGGGGIAVVGLETLKAAGTMGRTAGAGPMLDLGLGARLLFVTVGPRLRFSALPRYDLWQIDGEVALHVPVGPIDGYLGLHGGYAFASFGDTGLSGTLKVRGLDVGLQAGVDYYLSPRFSIGGELGGEILFMGASYGSSESHASAVGFAGRLGAHAGLHF